METNYVIAYDKPFYSGLTESFSPELRDHITFIDSTPQLTTNILEAINPRYIFFPHWSKKIPSSIYEKFECVIFHMTDLPYGRGGSPLQNLIQRGIYETQISALQCTEELDAGPIYLKEAFSLFGNAEEIYIRASQVMKKLIQRIIETDPTPYPQVGIPTTFQRRTPDQGNMAALAELSEVFDYIRMLDAEGYPPAFLETEQFKLEFTRAKLQHGSVIADVKITKKESLS